MNSLLSYKELVKLVSDGVITNCGTDLVNGASIDVTLGDLILTENRCIEAMGDSAWNWSKDFRAREPLNMEQVNISDRGYELAPGEFILAHSQQTFNLPADIACEYKLKSSMARIGLNHLNAGWCDPTWHGSALTMELVNTTRYHRLVLRPGDRIGQIVFFRCAPVPDFASYARKGRYNRDERVHGIKP